MDYYKEIKKELLDNEINRRVKNYSINKSDLLILKHHLSFLFLYYN